MSDNEVTSLQDLLHLIIRDATAINIVEMTTSESQSFVNDLQSLINTRVMSAEEQTTAKTNIIITHGGPDNNNYLTLESQLLSVDGKLTIHNKLESAII